MEKNGKAVEWEYTPAPLGDKDVEIKITHCGICQSDIHQINMGWGYVDFPLVPGHEIVGLIVAKGKDVSEFKIGERVGVGPQCDACLGSNKKCQECPKGESNYCSDMIWTYGSQYDDGRITRGGYDEAIRVPAFYVFKIPESLSSANVAPLLCAGATVWAPFLRCGVKQGTRLGVTGLGGLGHLAVQIGSKLGATVTVLSHTSSKKDDAIKLGASNFVDTSDKKQLSSATNAFDVLLVSAVYKGMDWNQMMKFAKPHATVIVVSLPEEDIKFNAFSLCAKNVNLMGSLIASPKEIRDLLEFSAKHNIGSVVELFPIQKINEALDHVRNGKARFRAVLTLSQ